MLIAGTAISFSGTGRLWPLACGVLIATALIVWGYMRSPASRGVRATCASLKLLGVAALALCLLEPLWNHERARPGANYFLVLADNSQGMQIKDKGETRSRGEQLKALLANAPATGWQEHIAENFQLRRYVFDARLHPADRVDLDFTGPATSLATSLHRVAERYRGQPLAGVLLFTDGNATDLSGPMETAGLPPVYPVVFGRDDVPSDVSVQKVAVSQTSFEDAPVTVQTEVSASGYRGEDIVVQLIDQNGRKVDEQTQRAERDEQSLAYRFRLKPAERGVLFYTVRAGSKAELRATTNVTASSEATLANNARAVAVDRGGGPYRVLYLSGRPNWEFKFLNRALDDDEQLNLVALIRIAKREPKFAVMGRRGETSNPLFRGFDKKDEETERYDQPVLVRLNTRDELELKGGFPKTAEELYGYHAIIVDDLEAEFFTRDQMMLVQKFVSERGGGFLMLGGAESFRQGNYLRTPVGDMLPVYLDRNTPRPASAAKLSLTREGWLQPWVRLRDNENDERARLKGVPAFEVLNEAGDVKPGASVLATVSDSRSHTFPALVAQRFGNGRTAALLIGDLWRWGMRDEAMRRDMDKAWRQMIRWLVSDVPGRIELQVSDRATEQAVALNVRVRDKNFTPLDNASVRLNISAIQAGSSNATNTVSIPAEPLLHEPGIYSATFIPRETGGYRAEAVVLDANGAEIGRAQAGWSSDPAADEFRSLKPNRGLLEQIAKQTGGEIIDAGKLLEFAKALPNRKAPITESVATPLWHTPWMFLFALACFAGEWGIRRWKGLP